jgi:hypothetical protein
MLSMVIYGLVESGSPWDTRGRRFDDSRVSDLTSLKYAIQTYYSTHSALPSNLDALKADQPYSNSQWIDPETKQNYEYNVNGTTSFQLCTTFSQKSPDLNSRGKAVPAIYPTPGVDNLSTHPKGHYCYDLPAKSATIYPQTYVNPTPAATPAPKIEGTPLVNCKMTEASDSAKLKIMGIYETSNSVIYTTNKLANGNIDYWTSDPKLASSAYMYATDTFDSSINGGQFNKVMGYRVHAFNTTGEKVVSSDYEFQGNRTVIADPRCL